MKEEEREGEEKEQRGRLVKKEKPVHQECPLSPFSSVEGREEICLLPG